MKRLFCIELTRHVEFKGWLEIEADDDSAAYAIVKTQVAVGDIYLKQVSDHTEIGPVKEISIDQRWQQEMQRSDVLARLAELECKLRDESV
jgi:hypothetical protein